MAAIAKSCIVIIALFSLISQGLCITCTNNDIKIETTKSGKVVQGKPEWNVVVTNSCKCAQFNIKVTCKAFQTVEPVSSDILSQQDIITYLLIKGAQLSSGATVKFSYAWDFAFRINPASSFTVPC
ncbi:hypothetical protein ACLB2K_017259 [Fragaria x ananassa]